MVRPGNEYNMLSVMNIMRCYKYFSNLKAVDIPKEIKIQSCIYGFKNRLSNRLNSYAGGRFTKNLKITIHT